MQKRGFAIVILAIALVASSVLAAFAQDDIDRHRTCADCGMDRKAYGFSRMLIQYEDGSQVGVCSLHCAVAELDANKGRAVKSLLVADRDTRTLIAAETAHWVIGGNRRGVMTKRPKWAFATKDAARAFIAKSGGEPASWDEAVAAAREDAAAKAK
jgi:nitrous oxide reductase accessory protein NosL